MPGVGIEWGGNLSTTPFFWGYELWASQLMSWPVSESRPVWSQALLGDLQKQTGRNQTQNPSISSRLVPLIGVTSAFGVSDPKYL